MSELDLQHLAQACTQAMWSEDHASRGLGMAVERVAPGEATVTMKVTQAMVNGHGTCHGGFIFALADSAFAFACNGGNERSVAQHCSITYLRPARLGDRLLAHATTRAREGRSGLYDVRVLNGGRETVAEFRGHSRTIGGTVLP